MKEGSGMIEGSGSSRLEHTLISFRSSQPKPTNSPQVSGPELHIQNTFEYNHTIDTHLAIGQSLHDGLLNVVVAHKEFADKNLSVGKIGRRVKQVFQLGLPGSFLDSCRFFLQRVGKGRKGILARSGRWKKRNGATVMDRP
jgi:hypothetical protein